MQLSDPVRVRFCSQRDGRLSGNRKQKDFIETILQSPEDKATRFALEIIIFHWRNGRVVFYISQKLFCWSKEPLGNVEETVVKHKCPHILQRKNSLPESLIIKKERKKSKNVAFITSYNGLILQ